MTQTIEEQRWAFELDGYILIPNLLGAAATARTHPLRWLSMQVCGCD